MMITSASNPRIKLVRKLEARRQRDKLGLFVCEGEDLVRAGVEAGLAPVEMLVDAERPPALEGLSGAEEVASELMAELSSLPHPARLIGVFRRADMPREADAAVGLALWHVGDPGNVGTLVRTADAFGPASLALSAGCADPTSAKALRASAGAVFRVPIGRFDQVPNPRVALITDDAPALADVELPSKVTFVLGAERLGLPDGVVEECDLSATIPITAGSESLNVATAGAIALYEFRRRREFD